MKSKKHLKICSQGHPFYKSSDCPTCPVCEEKRKPKDDFLSHLVAPARRALERENIKTIRDLSTYKESDILSLHGVGKTSIPILRDLLLKEGLGFKK